MIRIGGDFELEGSVLAASPGHSNMSHFFCGRYHSVLTDTGRSALYIAIDHILQSGGKKEAWLPIFCCESVIMPFVQHKCKINFYSCGFDLNTFSPPDITSKSILLFINYFGFCNKSVANWLESIGTSKDFFVIEDNVQATLSKGFGFIGDYSLNSFRKVLPVPDGSVLASKAEINYPLDDPDESFISRKLVAKLIRDFNEPQHISLLASAETDIDTYIRPKSMSWISRYLMNTIHLDDIRSRRRENWRNLLGKLQDIPMITPIFHEIEECEVPLALPITVNKSVRDPLRSYLINENIFCPIHWKLPKQYYDERFKADFLLSESILSLPIDQRMNESHIQYLIEILDIFFTKEIHNG